MTIAKRSLRAGAHLMLAGTLMVCTAASFAEERHEGWQERFRDGFGSHPTLPVPGALVFGAIAVGAAAAAARRRKGDKEQSADRRDGSDTRE